MSYSKINQKAEKIAEAIRSSIGIDVPQITDILQWFKHNFNYDLEIKTIDFSGQKISGMVHGNGPKGSYKILLSINESTERQHFSLYHELGHLIQNEGLLYGCFDGDVTNSKEEERF